MEESTPEQKCPLCGKRLESESLDHHLQEQHKELGGLGIPKKEAPLTLAEMQEARIRTIERETGRLRTTVIILILLIVLILFIIGVL